MQKGKFDAFLLSVASVFPILTEIQAKIHLYKSFNFDGVSITISLFTLQVVKGKNGAIF